MCVQSMMCTRINAVENLNDKIKTVFFYVIKAKPGSYAPLWDGLIYNHNFAMIWAIAIINRIQFYTWLTAPTYYGRTLIYK